MRVLIVIFGGVDYKLLSEYDCPALKQAEYHRATVRDLWNERDVATQITSQLLTGKGWQESGITGRKRYVNDKIELLEKGIIRQYTGTGGLLESVEWRSRPIREAIYRVLGYDLSQRNYVADDLECPTMLDLVPNSKAVYVPSYNPEPSWAIRRNILDPGAYPWFGEEGAIDLASKNHHWRRKKVFEALEGDFQLLVAQFQYLDSIQHLYGVYDEESRCGDIEAAYEKMDDLAREIKERADDFDRTLFISDNGMAKESAERTHYDRPFYSVDTELGRGELDMRDFYKLILSWVENPPNETPVQELTDE